MIYSYLASFPEWNCWLLPFFFFRQTVILLFKLAIWVIRIEQPIKQRDLWKERTFLASKSVILFCASPFGPVAGRDWLLRSRPKFLAGFAGWACAELGQKRDGFGVSRGTRGDPQKLVSIFIIVWSSYVSDKDSLYSSSVPDWSLLPEEERHQTYKKRIHPCFLFVHPCSSHLWCCFFHPCSRCPHLSHGISSLPDSLITQILLCLPTKDSVRTSILSTRFRNIWLQVPGLELHSHDFSDPAAIKNFIDRFLEINRESRLQKFKIKYDECNVYLFGISELIAEAINRGVHDLDIGTLKSPLTKDLMPVLMKIGVPRACTAKACASRGSGLGSSSRNRIPRGPVPRRPALTVYRGGAGQGGSVQPNCHLYSSSTLAIFQLVFGFVVLDSWV